MLDKRGYIRYIATGSAKFTPESDKSGVLSAEIIDISFRGTSVYLKERIEIGTIVHFELKVDSIEGLTLVGKGKVCNLKEHKRLNSSGFRTGIDFTEFNKNDAIELVNRIQAIICAETKKRAQAKQKDVGPL